MNEELIRRAISSIKCSVCGSKYHPENVTIIGHHDDLWILRLHCLTCNTKGLVAALVKKRETHQSDTDLSNTELIKFKRIEPVGVNDVLDMHNFLKDSDEDIASLLSK